MSEYDTKRTKTSATAGPSESDRFGSGKVATDLRARIIKVDIEGDMPKITIASGTTHGTRANMTGYIRAGVDGVLAEFQISEARQGLSFAFLPDVAREDLEGHLEVVINPTSRPPQPGGEIPTRAIHVEAVALGTRITIPRGKAHGIIVGTAGHLRSNEGRGSFVVTEVHLTRSRAIVHEPVDFVVANPALVLHRLSPKQRGLVVQRRADGSLVGLVDVQSTARAGVAGATSSLPFLDTIQRSFGKHDVSGVRAQIGGPAAESTRALGARAYATGNTVAFASSPDLHTAAHEAAHVVQQARGAVGFQGLGAAEDEHERQADAVADAVVAGRSAEPLLDSLSSASPSTAIQRAPLPSRPKGPGIAELHAARKAAKLVEQLVTATPQKLETLQTARESADPGQIRRAAGDVVQARALLEMSSITIREGIRAATGEERTSLQVLLERAKATIPTLVEAPQRALHQAQELHRVQVGSLSELPSGEAPRTPEETRRRANDVAPIGLCDDPTMQHTSSRACPLVPSQRSALRDVVGDSLSKIADDWHDAATDKQLEYRLRPLFEKTGLDPFTSILLTAIGWLGPTVLGLLRKAEAKGAAATLEQLAIANKVGASSEDKLLFGIYKKMSSTVMAKEKSSSHKGQNLFDLIREVQAAWKQVARMDIQQLPDPALVAMAEALQTAPYTIDFFREKLTRVVTNYDDILKIGKHTSVDRPERLPLVPVRVRHAKGAERIALARPTVKSVRNDHAKLGPEPGDDSMYVKDGNYAFHDWVDRALVSLVNVSASTPTLTSDDPRWRTEGGASSKSNDLMRWHDDPASTNDVNMLAVPKNPFVPKGSL